MLKVSEKELIYSEEAPWTIVIIWLLSVDTFVAI